MTRLAVPTVCQLLNAQAASRPATPAISWRRDGLGHTLTWEQYREQVYITASALLHLGVQAGQCVAVLAGNRVEHLMADLASAHCGAASLSLYPTLAAEQLAYIVADAQPAVIIVEGDAALARIRQLPWVRANRPVLVALDDDHDGPAGSSSQDDHDLSWADMTRLGERSRADTDSRLQERIDAVRPEDPLTYIYTSGTTGPSKGVIVTHRNVLHQVESLLRTGSYDYEYRSISYLPLAHVAERTASVYLPLRLGGHVLCCPDAGQLSEFIRGHRPSFFMAVPRFWEKLRAGVEMVVDSPAFEPHHAQLEKERRILRDEWQLRHTDAPVPAGLRIDAMRAKEGVVRDLRTALGLDQTVFAMSCGAPIADEVTEFFASIGVQVGQAYGLSESGGAVVCDRPGDGSRGSVGLPLPGYEIRIAEDGEVLVRSPANTTGYRNRPEATAELLTPEGWLHTGDIGHLDEVGRLHITDRKKELIITSAGKNIAPTAIESLLTGHQFLDWVVAVGEGRKYVVTLLTVNPQGLRAFAEAHGIHGAATDELIKHSAVLDAVRTLVDEANVNLSRPEQIKHFALLADQWSVETGELTPTFKLRRNVIHEKYRDRVDALYR